MRFCTNQNRQQTLRGWTFGKRLPIIVGLLLVLVILSGCQPSGTAATEDQSTTEALTTAVEATTAAESSSADSNAGNPSGGNTYAGMVPEALSELPKDRPLATIEMSDGKTIVLALYPEYAPNTVNNFIELAEGGFYDGLIFHRVINGFMIQGGDPEGTGIGGPGYGIPGEFTSNGFENPINHRPGIISMARSQHPDSAGSQFFICQGETGFLDGEYAAFGQVVTGQENIDAIAAVPTDSQDKPVTDVVIKSIKIDRQGYTFDKVNKN